MKARSKGILQVTASGMCFGFLGIFGKLASRHDISIGELLSFRFLTAGILLFILLKVFSPRRLKISAPDLLICAGLGILGYAVFSTLYFYAIHGVSVATASLLLYTYPAWVVLGAFVLFRERPSPLQILSVPVLGLGLYLLISTKDGLALGENAGAIFSGLAAAATYALYILASSRLQKSIDPLTSGLYVILFAALGLILFHRPDFRHVLTFSFSQFFIVIGIAVLCTVLPLVLFLSGLQKLGNTEASILSTVEPLTAALLGMLLLDEILSQSEMLGGGLVVLALIVTTISSSRR